VRKEGRQNLSCVWRGGTHVVFFHAVRRTNMSVLIVNLLNFFRVP